MEVITKTDRSLWKTFVDDHPQGNIFHTPEIFDVFSRTKGYQTSFWAIKGDGQEILAMLMPVQVTLVNGPLRYFTTRAVSYGSVLAVNDYRGQEALALLLKTYNHHVPIWPIFTELRNNSDQTKMQSVFHQHGYAYEDHLNYLIDLDREPDVVLQSFNDDARRRIRKSLKRGVLTIKEINNRSEIATFYSLLQKTYHYARVPLVDISLFEAAFDILLPKKMIRFVMAYIDDIPVTASVSLLYKDVIYGWYNGTDRDYRSYSPNEFEVWELINWGIENGYHTFDFGGAGRPNEKYGVRDFKAKFNGKLVNYGRNAYVHDPFRMKLSKMSYGLARFSMENYKVSLINIPKNKNRCNFNE